MSNQSKDTLFFLTDTPPLRNIAPGNFGFATCLLDVLREKVSLVITHRYRRSVNPGNVRRLFGMPILFYPDFGSLGLKRFFPGFTDFADTLCSFLLWRRYRKLSRELKPSRLFVLAAFNGWFLLTAWLISRACQLPLDIYLVDDLTHSARLGKRRILQCLIKPLERAVLKRASRIFVISKSYIEHLRELYGVEAEWLPTPISIDKMEHQSYKPSTPDVRSILFVGSPNPLYFSALIEIYAAIQAWNKQPNRFRLKLRMVGMAAPTELIENIPNTDDLEYQVQLPAAELEREAQKCWATILPYSFQPEQKTMVSTSFSWKLNDSYRAGRPIIVYGPAYASIPQYFIDAQFPLCATSIEELTSVFNRVEDADTPLLISQYAEVWKQHHSPTAIRNVICPSSGIE